MRYPYITISLLVLNYLLGITLSAFNLLFYQNFQGNFILDKIYLIFFHGSKVSNVKI